MKSVVEEISGQPLDEVWDEVSDLCQTYEQHNRIWIEGWNLMRENVWHQGLDQIWDEVREKIISEKA